MIRWRFLLSMIAFGAPTLALGNDVSLWRVTSILCALQRHVVLKFKFSE